MKKKKLSILLNFFLISVAFFGSSSQGADKPKIAVKTPIISSSISKQNTNLINLDKLLSELEASIVKTRKFDVVTRKNSALEAVLEEQDFSQSEFSKGNAAKSGELSNINYWIIPTIQQFELKKVNKPIPNISGKFRSYDTGILEIDIQVLDTTTGGIKETFYLHSEFESKKKTTSAVQVNVDMNYFTSLAKNTATQMADQLIDSVFPMKALNVKGKQIWINRGLDGGLSIGMRLDVYGQSESFTDPDTQEIIVIDGDFLGEAVVKKILPKYSITEFQGDISPSIKRGSILRKQQK